MRTGIGSALEPLGTNGSQRRRFWFHHLPLTIGSAVLLISFMRLPIFDVSAYPHDDIVSGTFPRRGADQAGTHAHDARDESSPARDHRDHRTAHGTTRTHRGGGHGSEGNHRTADVTRARHGTAGAGGHNAADSVGEHATGASSRSIQQVTVATGYLAVVLLAVTLLLGPANLLLRRRNPISSYPRRDVGIWAAIFSVIHVTAAVLIHVSHGSGAATTVLHFFIDDSGRMSTNSFGLGSWTGLAALVIALGLLATSSDAALRTLKARRWKWIQRLTYASFALVVLHAFFYGALLRMTSPFTQLLVLSVAAVLAGQAAGVWLWNRRSARLA